MNDFNSVLNQIIEKTTGRPQHLWSILTALRSCDDMPSSILTDEFKDYTTARLRGFLGFSKSYFNTRTTPLTKDEQAKRDTWLKCAPYHFLWHWRAAVQAVQECYGYDLDKETVCTPIGYKGFVK